jgi:hypothetical protein
MLFDDEQQQAVFSSITSWISSHSPPSSSGVIAAAVTAATTSPPPAAANTPPEFAPVLNGPAFVSFAIIAVLFGLLQWRVRAIEQAVLERRAALAAVRAAKAVELSQGKGVVGVDDDGGGGGGEVESSASSLAQEALRRYRRAYDKVEDLREIAPGVRLRAPGIVDQENSRAAQQFLGIDPNTDAALSDSSSSTSQNPMAPQIALGVLVVVGASQLALLYFMLSQDDPMQSIF